MSKPKPKQKQTTNSTAKKEKNAGDGVKSVKTVKKQPFTQRFVNAVNPHNWVPKVVEFFETKPHIWLSFLIPVAVMVAAYFYFGVYPVGHTEENGNKVMRSVLSLDLNAQYAYYFAYMKDALFGPESIFYSWSRNMSGEFVGIIGYYLFSPFNLIVWLCPLEHLTEGLLVMIVTKIGFVGVTMSYYLDKSRGFKKHTVVMFSCAYALMSYNIVQTMNPMWLDGVMALPLVVLGIESLLKRGKYKLFIVSLVYSFVTCFYIGYMTAIFTVLYFIYYAVTSRNLLKKTHQRLLLKRGGLFGVSAIIAGLVSAFILLPVYSALSLGKFDFSTPDYSIARNFSFLDMTRKLFTNSYDTVRMEGMPFLFVGSLALILLPLYFCCKRVKLTKRVSGFVLMMALIVSMIIKPMDMMWHGGQNPNWLPYRYSFMLCFLMLVFAGEAFENLKRIPRKSIGISALFFCGLIFFWENKDTVIMTLNSGKGRDVFDWFATAFVSMMFILLFALFLILARNKFKKHNLFTASMVAIVCIEMFFNVHNSLEAQNTDITYSTRDSFVEPMIPTREITDQINSEDKSLFRMEKTYIRGANDPMALRMNGFTHSSSMLNTKAISFLKGMGYSSRSHASRYSGATPLTDDLFGFKYILSCKDNDWRKVKTTADITVTPNGDVMPIAYLVNPKFQHYYFSGPNNKHDDVFSNQNRMLSYMLGEELNEYFVRVEPREVRPQNVTQTTVQGHKHYKRGGEAKDSHIEYYMTADKAGDFYMYFPTEFEKTMNLWLDGKFLGNYYNSDNYYIRHLGYFEEGAEFKMTMSIPKEENDLYFKEEYIMRLDRELLEADIARLHQINANTVFDKKSNTKLKITTNNPDDTVLFTSIPVEPGWTVKLNGKKVKKDDLLEICDVVIGTETIIKDDGTEGTNDIKQAALMAVYVPGGENTIELSFFPHLLPLGILLTFVGIGGFVALGYVLAYFDRKRVKKPLKIYSFDDYDGYDAEFIKELEDMKLFEEMKKEKADVTDG